jgi:xanthine dehydrogenase accessory factor
MSGFGCILGDENHLYIFGGGHISQCLAPLALATGFFVTVIEDRPEFENNVSNVRYTICNSDKYENEINLMGHEYAVICTRGHKTDDAALRFCLSKKLRYIGMIGSTGKVKILFEKLKEEGYTERELKKVYAPIGLDIASSVPSEIAVSIMAEILLIKNKGTPGHKNKLA